LPQLVGKKVFTAIKGPYLQDMEGFYGILDNGTAVIEMAACAGLPLVEDDKHPDKATSFGVGQLMVMIFSPLIKGAFPQSSA
jgi:glycerate kinase